MNREKWKHTMALNGPRSAIKTAISEARRSDHSLFKHGCVIFKGKRVLAAGHNRIRSARSISTRFVNHPYSIHAEIDAILRARRNLRGCSVLVIRLSKNGRLVYSRPCEQYRKYIDYVGIRHIFYSTSNGGVEELTAA